MVLIVVLVEVVVCYSAFVQFIAFVIYVGFELLSDVSKVVVSSFIMQNRLLKIWYLMSDIMNDVWKGCFFTFNIAMTVLSDSEDRPVFLTLWGQAFSESYFKSANLWPYLCVGWLCWVKRLLCFHQPFYVWLFILFYQDDIIGLNCIFSTVSPGYRFFFTTWFTLCAGNETCVNLY